MTELHITLIRKDVLVFTQNRGITATLIGNKKWPGNRVPGPQLFQLFAQEITK
jgi:hypothetical protein